MKSLNAIQLELLREGFKLVSGKEIGSHDKIRTFRRSEGEHKWSLVEVHLFQETESEEIEAEEEGLEEELSPEELLRRFPHHFRDPVITDFEDFHDRAFVISKLVSRYPDEIVKLINAGQLDVPKWILKELAEAKLKA